MTPRKLGTFVTTALLAACTTAPRIDVPMPAPEPPAQPAVTRAYPSAEDPPVPVPIAEPSAASRALDYVNRARQRSPREQRLEYDALRKAFSASRSDHDRVRLALLLSLPNAAFADEGQALELLEPLARDTGSEYHALAQLMTMLLTEQRRLGKQATALQQKLDRIRALEKEMQQRAATPEPKRR